MKELKAVGMTFLKPGFRFFFLQSCWEQDSPSTLKTHRGILGCVLVMDDCSLLKLDWFGIFSISNHESRIY